MAEKGKTVPLTARERLAQISHHFLSDQEAETPGPVAHAFTLAVIQPQMPHWHLPCEAIARHLASSGRAVAIEDEVSRYNACFCPEKAVSGPAALISTGGDPTDLDLRCLILGNRDIARLSIADAILIASGADDDAARQAYLTIKQLTGLLEHSPIVGITITGAKDIVIARHYFGWLAKACFGFLDLSIVSYGYISDRIPAVEAGSPTEVEPSTQPGAIARLLEADIQNWSRQRRQPLHPIVSPSTDKANYQ